MTRANRKHPALGMTLMEVVIAIGVVAFVIPLILAATGSAGDSRRSAEADTRSVWLARQVQQEVLSKWAEPPRSSVIESAIAFPAFASADSPEVLAYDTGGVFLAKGSAADLTAPSKVPNAAYLVAVHAEAYEPVGVPAVPGKLAMLHIRVIHPAKAAPGGRSTYRYNLVTPRQGIQ